MQCRSNWTSGRPFALLKFLILFGFNNSLNKFIILKIVICFLLKLRPLSFPTWNFEGKEKGILTWAKNPPKIYFFYLPSSLQPSPFFPSFSIHPYHALANGPSPPDYCRRIHLHGVRAKCCGPYLLRQSALIFLLPIKYLPAAPFILYFNSI